MLLLSVSLQKEVGKTYHQRRCKAFQIGVFIKEVIYKGKFELKVGRGVSNSRVDLIHSAISLQDPPKD